MILHKTPSNTLAKRADMYRFYRQNASSEDKLNCKQHGYVISSFNMLLRKSIIYDAKVYTHRSLFSKFGIFIKTNVSRSSLFLNLHSEGRRAAIKLKIRPSNRTRFDQVLSCYTFLAARHFKREVAKLLKTTSYHLIYYPYASY
jgi:hypothetical protein